MGVGRSGVIASCPECGRKVNLGAGPIQGRRLGCSYCGAYLEIINLEPPELDWAFSDFDPGWDTDEEEWDEHEWEEKDWNGKGSTTDQADSDDWGP